MNDKLNLIIGEPEHISQSFDFSGVAMPLVRSVFPQINPQDLICVQPMTTPTAAIFYMDYKFMNELPDKLIIGS